MKRYIRMQSHRDDPKIPKGYAVLVMDDNGFVGTNNGEPFVGLPALYPETQAAAIVLAWNMMLMGDGIARIPNPAGVEPEVMRWFTGELTAPREDYVFRDSESEPVPAMDGKGEKP